MQALTPVHPNTQAPTIDSEAVDADGLPMATLEQLKTLYSQWNRGDIMGRHAIGLIVADLTEGPTYGTGAVVNAARALGTSPSWLHDARKVAEAWDADDLAELLQAVDAGSGRPLSWSHLIELAEHPVAGERRDIALEASREHLNVQGLRDRLKARLHGTTTPPPAPLTDAEAETARNPETTGSTTPAPIPAPGPARTPSRNSSGGTIPTGKLRHQASRLRSAAETLTEQSGVFRDTAGGFVNARLSDDDLNDLEQTRETLDAVRDKLDELDLWFDTVLTPTAGTPAPASAV